MTYYNYLGQPMPQSTTPTVGVYGTSTSGDETLTAPAGVSAVTTAGPNDVLIGASGDTTFYLKNSGAQVIETPNGGIDTEVAWTTTRLAPNVENLSVNGDYNHGIGNSLDNLITGNGRSWLYGGGGNDVLVGASGTTTTFAVHADDGNDVIYNWQSTDQLQLSGFTFKTAADVTAAMKQVGSDVLLQLSPSQTLTFRNISLANAPFQAKQFLLPFDSSVLGRLTLDDEFNALNLHDASTGQGIWQTNFGGDPTNASTYTIQANGEKEIYTDPNFAGTAGHNLNLNPFSINNGILSITAGQIPQAEQSSTWSYGYYSGMLNTLSTFQQKYGYFEMRAQLPNAVGTWPAFWMETTPYTRSQEADIMESLGSTPDTHYVRAYGLNDVQSDNALKLDPNGWHTYGMLWTPTTVAFYIDGVEVMHGATPASWTSPMSLVLNMAIGGWGGNPDPSQYPATMNVDYVRAYALADGSTQVIDHTSGGGSAAPPADGGGTTTPPSGGGTPGQLLTAAQPNMSIAGGAGDDTLVSGPGYDTLTGGDGHDHFVLPSEPWAPTVITDFQLGTDQLDLSALFQKSGYAGADPVADHYIYLVSDGAGGTNVRFDRDGAGGNPQWPNTIIDLKGVSPNGLTWAQLAGGSTPSTGGGTTTPPSDGGGTTTPPPDGGGTTTPPSGGGSSGVLLTAAQPNMSIAGGAGDDTLVSGPGYDTLTGGAGHDRFVLPSEPWAPTVITDFQVGGDQLDLSALFQKAGYTGADPVADHYIYLVSDGAGGTNVRFDHDGGGPNPQWPNTIIDLKGVALTGLTWAQLAGGSGTTAGGTTTPPSDGGGTTPPATGGTAGQMLTASQPYLTLTGGAGDDTLNAGPGYDTLTGGAGRDHFVLPTEPWAPITITDFQAGSDQLDFTALFQKAGYTGGDPVADGYMFVQSDNHGGSIIRFDHDGPGPNPVWPNTIIDLAGVAPSAVKVSDWIVH